MQTINLPIVLDESLAVPLYEQITQYVKDAIIGGQLAHGSVIGSSRELSKKLGVSRQTVMHSMEILQSQGFVESTNGKLIAVAVERNNDIVSSGQGNRSNDVTPLKSDFGERVLALGHNESCLQIDPVAHRPYELPFHQWRRLVQKHLHDEARLLGYSVTDELGCSELRLELKDYLGRSRSVVCDPDQIVIFPDTISALDLITRLLLDDRSDIAVENPTRQSNLTPFRAHNLELHPLDVDEEGACVHRLGALLNPPKVVYLTPSSNNPLAIPMSINRRRDLLSWADKNGCMIIENDEDGFYRYTGRPLPSLQGLDPTRGRVIYLSSFRTVLEPLNRLAFVVVPKNLCSRFVAARQTLHQGIPLLDQLVLADFLKSGFLERHIRNSTHSLAHRRRSLMIALTKAFQRSIRIAGESVGENLLVSLATQCSVETVMVAAQRAGLTLESTGSFHLLHNPPGGQFIISFAYIDETDIETRVHEFSKLLQSRDSGQ